MFKGREVPTSVTCCCCHCYKENLREKRKGKRRKKLKDRDSYDDYLLLSLVQGRLNKKEGKEIREEIKDSSLDDQTRVTGMYEGRVRHGYKNEAYLGRTRTVKPEDRKQGLLWDVRCRMKHEDKN